MNKLLAKVTDIQTCELLNIVNFDFNGILLSMMSLELENLKVQDKVVLAFKPTSVGIGKNLNGDFSYSNQIKGKVKSVENGQLLTYVKILINDDIIESVITQKSSQKMDLKKDDEVVCIVKASDLSILEILHD